MARQKILAIPQRRHTRPTVTYLSKEELAEILAQPDLRTSDGRRDAVLLSVLYDIGARVQELIDLSVGDVRLDPPAQLRLLGKGRRMRAVPLMRNTVQLLRDHMQEKHLDGPEEFDKPLFQNGAINGCRVPESATFFKNISWDRDTVFFPVTIRTEL